VLHAGILPYLISHSENGARKATTKVVRVMEVIKNWGAQAIIKTEDPSILILLSQFCQPWMTLESCKAGIFLFVWESGFAGLQINTPVWTLVQLRISRNSDDHKTKPQESMASPRYASMQTCLWNCFWFYTHNSVALESLSGKITPKRSATLSPEFDGCAGEPYEKASWLVESWGWAIKAVPYLELVPHNQHF